MGLTARDVMRSDVKSVSPRTTLADLERALIDARVSGFPVVEAGRLVGIVSRSDVVRQFYVERSLDENVSDFYRGAGDADVPGESLESIGRRVGARVEGLHVEDVMIRELIAVAPDTPLREVAQRLVDRRIHRLPVVDQGRLVGIVTSLDLVGLFADGRA